MASKYKSLKEEALEANKEIPARGLALYTWGNVSVFDSSKGLIAIKPSGVDYASLKIDDIVVVSIDGTVVEGRLSPSSDTQTHLALYRHFEASGAINMRSIIHTHSPHAVAWAQSQKSIPIFGTTHADHIQVSVPCTGLLSKKAVEQNYELETGNLIVEYFNEHNIAMNEVTMVLVGGHGPFAWGESGAKAVYTAAVLEEVARMAWMTLQINSKITALPNYIVAKHYQRKHGSNAYYGQK